MADFLLAFGSCVTVSGLILRLPGLGLIGLSAMLISNFI